MLNKKYDNLLFDLDGTLTESHTGIINSIEYALSKFGLTNLSHELLMTFIGPPLTHCFKKHFGFDESRAQKALAFYRDYFDRQGMYENRVYEDVEETLRQLKDRGHRLFVATSKPETAAVAILKHFGLYKYFDYVAGATLDSSRCQKPDVIKYALETNSITDLSSTVMIGDRVYDVEGAKQNGIQCVGVLYGYGNREELEAAGAICLAQKPSDLLNLL